MFSILKTQAVDTLNYTMLEPHMVYIIYPSRLAMKQVHDAEPEPTFRSMIFFYSCEYWPLVTS